MSTTHKRQSAKLCAENEEMVAGVYDMHTTVLKVSKIDHKLFIT